MARRVITREEMVQTFAPARAVIQVVIDRARAATTLERYRELHPEITRDAGLSRLAGQGRWLMLTEGLVVDIGSVPGFGVQSTDAQHNQGQYLFRCPGGLMTVKREPHDDENPDDGRYIQETLIEILEQAELAPDIDPDAPLVVYLAVTATTAMLKIRHATLPEIMKIPITDLIAPPMPAPQRPDRQRARARSTRRPARTARRPAVEGPAAAP